MATLVCPGPGRAPPGGLPTFLSRTASGAPRDKGLGEVQVVSEIKVLIGRENILEKTVQASWTQPRSRTWLTIGTLQLIHGNTVRWNTHRETKLQIPPPFFFLEFPKTPCRLFCTTWKTGFGTGGSGVVGSCPGTQAKLQPYQATGLRAGLGVPGGGTLLGSKRQSWGAQGAEGH